MDLATFLIARLDDLDPLRGQLSDDLPHHPYCAGMTADDDWQYVFRPDLCDCGWPQRVLAWCAAMRAIVELHEPIDGNVTAEGDPISACNICVNHGWLVGFGDFTPYPCPTLLALAQLFVDHPGFDPSWRAG